jgi:hypothetical protein
VVNPHLLRLLDSHSVTGRCQHLADLQVANNDVLNVEDANADTVKRGTLLAKDGLVRAGLDRLISGNSARDDDNLLVVASNSRLQRSERGDGNSSATGAARGAKGAKESAGVLPALEMSDRSYPAAAAKPIVATSAAAARFSSAGAANTASAEVRNKPMVANFIL